MPTALRITLMVGEIIGFAILSVICIIKIYKDPRASEDFNWDLRNKIEPSIRYLIIINNVINILLFLFADITNFTSYYKFIILSIYVICCSLILIAYLAEPKFLCTFTVEKIQKISFIIATLALAVSIIGFVIQLIFIFISL